MKGELIFVLRISKEALRLPLLLVPDLLPHPLSLSLSFNDANKRKKMNRTENLRENRFPAGGREKRKLAVDVSVSSRTKLMAYVDAD